MNVRQLARTLVPKPIRPLLRRLASPWLRAHRLHVLRNSVRELRRATRGGAIPIERIRALREAWGNEGFSADEFFLSALADAMLASDGPFLDLGSGLTTLVAGAIADAKRLTVISLEQDASWSAEVSATLEGVGITSVTLWHAPLKSHGDFAWYEVSDIALPAWFAHIFCDGPAIGPRRWPEAVHAGWRVGVVPVLQWLGIRFGGILLDDETDPRCPALCRKWNELGIHTRVVATPTGSFVVGSEWAGGPSES
ncbi:MAG: hypothetical protein L0271_12115 [Gemmatimonadetes bacterium]|nr:hypothetical protein [Gemmatimonadota bacterium]